MKNLIRIAIALIITLLGIAGSYYYLSPNTGVQTSSKKQKAMAKIAAVVNDVKRQSNDKIIWEPVRKGDLLFLGDKIKTSPLSNSKIEFLDNGTSIDVEAESLIVISKNNKKLTLQVMEGSLFVSSNQDTSNMALTSGNKNEKEIALKNGDFSFSVNKEGKSNLEVIKGSIGNSGANQFKNLKPNYGDSIFIDSKTEEDLEFSFQPIPEQYQVIVEIGNSRNNLIEDKNANIDLNSGVIKTKPIIGTFFWKLKAINKNDPNDNFQSSVFKLSTKQKIPPIPMYPIANDIVQLKNEKEAIEFKWSLPHAFDTVEIEVKSNDGKGQVIINENVSNQTFFATNKITRPGKYTWKIIGKLNGNKISLSSQDQPFIIIHGEELQSPTLQSPDENFILFSKNSKENFLNNIHLSWKPVKEAKEYLLTIKNKENQKREFKVNLTEFNIPKLITGQYTWYVQSINEKNEVSKKINNRTFSISQLATLSFINLVSNLYYTTSFPSYKFQWNNYANAATYHLKISQNQSMNPSETLTTRDNFFTYQIGKEGNYFFTVEALNTDNTVIATSEISNLNVSKPPAPPAPIFLNVAKNWESNLSGDMKVELSNYTNKFQTIFELYDSKGALIDQNRSSSNNVNFKSLSPGNYIVIAKFIDEYNQTSEQSIRKAFNVPEKSAIAAPKVKGVKVR